MEVIGPLPWLLDAKWGVSAILTMISIIVIIIFIVVVIIFIIIIIVIIIIKIIILMIISLTQYFCFGINRLNPKCTVLIF